MENKYIKKIIAAIRNHALLSTIKHAVADRWRICFIRNRGILKLQRMDMLYRKFSKKYRNIITKANHTPSVNSEFSKTIWWCWLQGYDQAPELVQSCYESLRKNMPGYDIRIITAENLSDHITLPNFIAEKFNRGIIDFTHYSDIIRLELLIRYGGVWIDATVLCTDSEMCPVLESAPLFVYQILARAGSYSVASNWLISAKPASPVLCLTRDLLLEYWKHYNLLEHYLIFHLFFSMALREFPEIWSQIPPYNNVSPQMLCWEMNYAYSDQRYTVFKKFSSFHKLSYKESYSSSKNTFYDVLIRLRKF